LLRIEPDYLEARRALVELKNAEVSLQDLERILLLS